ncbi:MAG: CO dehydrogenase/acetyl-CoA synthase complex subunit alpha [Methermicoccaceae archaeon]
MDGGVFKIKGMENVKIYIGDVSEEEEEWEPEGPTIKPDIQDLRGWDMKLLKRYAPTYSPVTETCSFCTYGPCDLSGGKEGACGINLRAQQARLILFTTLMGAAAHAAHGRHILHYLIERYGKDFEIDVGQSELKTPNISVVVGIRPTTLGGLEKALDYVEEQLAQLLASLHTGQEGSYLDFESKALHAGMLDHVGMEVADVSQVAALNMPKADENAELVEIGMGIIDSTKPVILVVGHNVAGVWHIMDYLDTHDLNDTIEMGGVCCTAIDMTRCNPKRKIVGSLSQQLKYVRTGIPDVIVVDEQCIRTDMVDEASKLGIPVISTNAKVLYGLPDRTDAPVDEVLDELVSGKEKGIIMLDFDKLGELVPKIAMKIAPSRREKGYTAIPTDEEMQDMVESCVGCGACEIQCPQGLPLPEAFALAKEGDFSKFGALWEECVGCGRCEQDCPKDIRVLDVLQKAARKMIFEDKSTIRAGRGQVSDPEIREEGRNLVLGVTPGVVAIIGCPNFPRGPRELYETAEELLARSYIVVVNGCSAMEIAHYKDDEGKSLYERYPGRFIKGNLLNTGSCVSNSSITSALIKVATIFARKQARGNYEEIADYILNRVGAVGVAWGAYSQKAQSIGLGCVRLGVPVIVGPHGVKYRRAFIGSPYIDEEWEFYDARDGTVQSGEAAPEHLVLAADTKEEMLPLIAKLCIRPSDNNLGRMIKLTHYIELSEKYHGKFPDDWHTFVRGETDLPLAMKDTLLKMLEEEQGWKIDWDKKKIVEGPTRKMDVSCQPTIVPRLVKSKGGV